MQAAIIMDNNTTVISLSTLTRDVTNMIQVTTIKLESVMSWQLLGDVSCSTHVNPCLFILISRLVENLESSIRSRKNKVALNFQMHLKGHKVMSIHWYSILHRQSITYFVISMKIMPQNSSKITTSNTFYIFLQLPTYCF